MIVLDASALVEVVTDQGARDQVVPYLRGTLVAPAHQPAEALSAIARMARAGVLTSDGAAGALGDVARLDQDLVVPTATHLRRALDLQDRIRVVDGLYVALAEQLGAALLTTDARLVGADPPCDVIYAGA